jgi:hypothetical protein
MKHTTECIIEALRAGAWAAEIKLMDIAADRLEELQKERDNAHAEAEHLKAYPARPEPSRLEIAAMLVAGRFSATLYVTEVKGTWVKYALDGADALIAAAKEVK